MRRSGRTVTRISSSFRPRTAARISRCSTTAWDKYGLAKFAGAAFPSNTLLDAKPAHEKRARPRVTRRRVVARHSIAALRSAASCSCRATTRSGNSRSGSTARTRIPTSCRSMLAADLTNHVIPSAIVTPGAGRHAARTAAGRLHVRKMRPHDDIDPLQLEPPSPSRRVAARCTADRVALLRVDPVARRPPIPPRPSSLAKRPQQRRDAPWPRIHGAAGRRARRFPR